MSDQAKVTGDFQSIEGDTTTWVEIASASTQDEALLLRGFLQNEGIPCQVESLKFDELPVNVGSMGEIRVYVPVQFEARALELQRDREAQYSRLDEEGESVVTDDGPAVITDDAEAVGDPDEI